MVRAISAGKYPNLKVTPHRSQGNGTTKLVRVISPRHSRSAVGSVEMAAKAHIELTAHECEEAVGARAAPPEAVSELFLHAIDDLAARIGDPARGRRSA